MPFFESISLLPDDPILSIPLLFAADPYPEKVNLGIGAYRDAEGNPVVLSSVRKAEETLQKANLLKEYLPIAGREPFIREALKLLFGESSPLLDAQNIAAVQAICSSGALRIGGQFLACHTAGRKIYLPSPTWSNHHQIFRDSGLVVEEYPHYHRQKNRLDFSGMLRAIESMEPNNALLFHACCHNPTGVDPTQAEWRALSALVKERRLIPFFDLAYQGFDRGLEEDAEAVRLFASEGHTLFVASTFSKNLGLYGERCGLLSAVAESPSIAEKLTSHFKKIVRGLYSTPPQHPALIAETVLASAELKAEWIEELERMRQRVQEMRRALVSALLSKIKDFDFSFLSGQTGMFSFTGLSEDQVQQLRAVHHIYLPKDGRINVAGLNRGNLDYVVEAISSVL